MIIPDGGSGEIQVDTFVLEQFDDCSDVDRHDAYIPTRCHVIGGRALGQAVDNICRHLNLLVNEIECVFETRYNNVIEYNFPT